MIKKDIVARLCQVIKSRYKTKHEGGEAILNYPDGIVPKTDDISRVRGEG